MQGNRINWKGAMLRPKVCKSGAKTINARIEVEDGKETLWNPMDYSPPGSSVHGILLARILEWVAIPFSRRASLYMDQT